MSEHSRPPPDLPLLELDEGSAVPPFEQLRTQLASMVAVGELAPGRRLPTVRQLASDLGLAVNTVARAYRELEADSLITTQGRRGTFVRSTLLDDSAGGEAMGVRTAAREFASLARRHGLSLAEATRMVERGWPPTADT